MIKEQATCTRHNETVTTGLMNDIKCTLFRVGQENLHSFALWMEASKVQIFLPRPVPLSLTSLLLPDFRYRSAQSHVHSFAFVTEWKPFHREIRSFPVEREISLNRVSRRRSPVKFLRLRKSWTWPRGRERERIKQGDAFWSFCVYLGQRKHLKSFNDDTEQRGAKRLPGRKVSCPSSSSVHIVDIG